MAMPPPMVPPPITAAVRISRASVPSGRSGMRATSRSPKKAWRSARDCGELRSSRNISRSRFAASSNGRCSASCNASAAFTGATRPRAFFAMSASAFSSVPASPARTGRSRVRRGGRPSATMRRAKAIAPLRKSPSTISSMAPSASAFVAGTGLPPVIISSAASTPTSRGSRCVPPAPGMRPSVTSGSPTFASATATRQWQPSAISNPPPSAVPWIAAITGLGAFSMASITSGSAGGEGGRSNSRTSAPATKVVPSQAMTMAATEGSPRADSIAASSPARTACPAAFTGGLSMAMTAMFSWRVTVTTGMSCVRGHGISFEAS